MAEAAQTKVCPLCAETIKAKAKLCPFCRTRQSRFSLLKGELPATFIVLAVFIGMPFLMDWAFGNEPDNKSSLAFVVHRNDLSIGNVAWEMAGNDHNYWLTGYVTNHGNYSWRRVCKFKVVHFQCEKYKRSILESQCPSSNPSLTPITARWPVMPAADFAGGWLFSTRRFSIKEVDK